MSEGDQIHVRIDRDDMGTARLVVWLGGGKGTAQAHAAIIRWQMTEKGMVGLLFRQTTTAPGLGALGKVTDASVFCAISCLNWLWHLLAVTAPGRSRTRFIGHTIPSKKSRGPRSKSAVLSPN
jgi:hypothetical protein